ncbi:hypothetical protein R3P38DRAFT_2769009 [Favolaschia claudopus]|uniref:Uncharacterized protein n=1 Tax=Favolaschia claudopus TaxID=2862362 RepID=A0AAW0CPY2_9AGAR
MTRHFLIPWNEGNVVHSPQLSGNSALEQQPFIINECPTSPSYLVMQGTHFSLAGKSKTLKACPSVPSSIAETDIWSFRWDLICFLFSLSLAVCKGDPSIPQHFEERVLRGLNRITTKLEPLAHASAKALPSKTRL